MAARNPFRRYEVTEYQKKALNLLRPPENITVSEWADKYRMLDARSSAMPGPWRTDHTPYLRGVMDEFNNYETEEIIFVKPTQVGGTECLQNMVGYIIQQDPAPTMIVYPTDKLAESISENRLQPMLKASPGLRSKFIKSDSSKLELQFDGMYLTLAGSNSPSSLASKAIRYLFLDEVDKYPGASKKEADPISLARERTKTFHNRKIFITSTPTLRDGHIWKAKEEADIEKHYFVPCPHCGEYIELALKQIRFPKGENLSYTDRAEFATYVCQECGCIITDRNKPDMLKLGEWRIVKENTKFARKVAFWMNTLYSPFVRFSEVAREFLESHEDPDKLQNFANSWLAEPWEDTKLKTDADLVLERQTDVEEFIVPEWAKVLTAGVDVQETCFYWTIRAWGDYFTSQNIAHGQAYSFQEVERIMNLSYLMPDSTPLVVALALIDSGNDTDRVYDFCANNSEWALPSKGASNTMLTHYKLSKVNRADSRAYGMNLVLVDTGKYKDMIAGRMRKDNGSGAWMVYQGCDEDYANQVTAEHKVNVKIGAGKSRLEWVPKSSHVDNHYLDCEVYAFCAADILGVRTMHLSNVQDAAQSSAQGNEQYTPEEKWITENESWT